MRNYIHIQLCVTLGIAQIIFVAGVEPRLGEGGGVPIGCRSVAVLLHYWFLVSFMWMLMEGVVLYVALVRVFVKHYARYVAAFTIISYGNNNIYMNHWIRQRDCILSMKNHDRFASALHGCPYSSSGLC